jgi:hypothetical protein
MLERAKDYVKKLESEIEKFEGSTDSGKRVTGTLSNKEGDGSAAPNDFSSITGTAGSFSLHSSKSNQQISSYKRNDHQRVDQSRPVSTPELNSLSQYDNETVRWGLQLLSKLRCLNGGRGGMYLYHVRKAAGTTIREVMERSTRKWGVRMMETEGPTLNSKFLSVPGLLTVTTLREPVGRVLSMYWYEHVGWYDGILHETNKCKKLMEWVQAWRDGSEWKTSTH